MVKSPEEKSTLSARIAPLGIDITAFGALETADVVVVIVSIAHAAKNNGGKPLRHG